MSRTSFISFSFLASALAAPPGTAQVCPNLDHIEASLTVGSDPWCAASGDLDGNGADDLLIGRSPLFGTGGLVVSMRAGDRFAAPFAIPGPRTPRSIALGDVDADGDLDVVVSDYGLLVGSDYQDDGLRVLLGDGLGGFSPRPLLALGPRDHQPECVRLGDLDGDGDLDLALAVRGHWTSSSTSTGAVLAYLNDGLGGFTENGAYASGVSPRNLELVDFDGDRALDFAVLGQSPLVAVVLGHGDGSFASAVATYAAGSYPSGLTSGDFDGDGDTDLAVGSKYALRTLVNRGDGTFDAGVSQFFGYYNKGLISADYDQDGDLDLLATFASPARLVFLSGSGGGGFAAAKTYPIGSQAYALAAGEWNLDGMLDVAAADSGGNTLGIWTSQCGPATYCAAKTNSQGCTPEIGFLGLPSASSGSGFLVTAANVLNQKSGMLLYTTNGRDAIPFGGGTLCIAPPLRRTSPQPSGGSATGDDCTGAYAFDFNVRIASGIDPQLVPGAVVDAQYWSRDPGFPAPDNVGLTDALEFTIAP